ncbi:MAG: hypothetical protein KIT31_20830 [Deltaproteobacteria bacterium]|nr:hypothetical protein [Deltaproteobacteria bacterium]
MAGASTAPDGAGTPLAPDDDPTPSVVAKAFGGRAPALPLLAEDGRDVAVDLRARIGRTGVSTYAVAFVSVDGAVDVMWLVDVKTAEQLYLRAAGTKVAIDEGRIARAATAVSRRLRFGRYSPFESTVADLPPNQRIELATASLQLAESADGLTLTLADARREPVRRDVVRARPMGKVADLDCVSEPLPRAAYFDQKRRRVSIRIEWNAGPDRCDSPPAEHRLWELP